MELEHYVLILKSFFLAGRPGAQKPPKKWYITRWWATRGKNHFFWWFLQFFCIRLRGGPLRFYLTRRVFLGACAGVLVFRNFIKISYQ